jgi:hypothetical protein
MYVWSKILYLKGSSEISTEHDGSSWNSCDCTRDYAVISAGNLSVQIIEYLSIEFLQNLRSCGIAYMWSPFIALSEIWFMLNQYGCNQNFPHNIHWERLIENFNRDCEKKKYGNEDSSLLGRSPSRLANSGVSYCFCILRAKQSKAVLFMGVFNEAIQTHTQTHPWGIYMVTEKSLCTCRK